MHSVRYSVDRIGWAGAETDGVRPAATTIRVHIGSLQRIRTPRGTKTSSVANTMDVPQAANVLGTLGAVSFCTTT